MTFDDFLEAVRVWIGGVGLWLLIALAAFGADTAIGALKSRRLRRGPDESTRRMRSGHPKAPRT